MITELNWTFPHIQKLISAFAWRSKGGGNGNELEIILQTVSKYEIYRSHLQNQLQRKMLSTKVLWGFCNKFGKYVFRNI